MPHSEHDHWTISLVQSGHLRSAFCGQPTSALTVAAAEAGTAFVPWIWTPLAEMLCSQEERVGAKDNTVRYQGLSLQIPPDRHRFHHVKATVRVHDYPHGTLVVFHGPRCLARYQPYGQLIEPDGTQLGCNGATR